MANIESRRADNGTISYRVKVRLKGQSPTSSTFSRLTDDRRWAQSIEAAMREGRHFKTAEARRHTLADLIDRYIKEALPTKPKNASNSKQHLLWWKSKLGSVLLADVSPSLLTQSRNELLGTITRRGSKMANATVVRYMASLSHAFTIAMKDWQWVDDSPLRKVSKPKEPRGRDRYLLEHERERLLIACSNSASPDLHTVVTLALCTGSHDDFF